MPRLFIAIDIPPDIREDIANICHGAPYAKWIELGQMHLTIQFIGEVDDGKYREICDALSSIEHPTFSFSLKGVGYFPPRKDPRVLWVGVDKGDEIIALNDKIETALRSIGVEPENRKFHPHITIARFKDRVTVPSIADFLVSNSLFRSHREIPVGAFYLYSSTLNRHGAVHNKEMSFPLLSENQLN
jgi:RNA 2',3'-cyclic 3'-phosphodiesterase